MFETLDMRSRPRSRSRIVEGESVAIPNGSETGCERLDDSLEASAHDSRSRTVRPPPLRPSGPEG